VEGAPTEELRPDASNARSQRPATRATGARVSCSCLCVETPVVAHRPFTLPRSSILCGCIVNAVWGRCPTACAMYANKSLRFIGELVDKTSPAFELRNSGVPAAARSFLLYIPGLN
jgi:hypothetical protein